MKDLTDALAVAAMQAPRPPRSKQPAGTSIIWGADGAATVDAPHQGALPVDDSEWVALAAKHGLVVPDGWAVRLVSATHDPAAWHRDQPGEDAVTRAVWRLRFTVSPGAPRLPMDDLLRDARSAPRARKTGSQPAEGATFVVALGDLQLGKADADGAAGTVARTLRAIGQARDELAALPKGTPVLLAWLGDCIEGFVSQAGRNAWRTELSLTEQTRALRRIMMHAATEIGTLTPDLTIMVAAGNHDQAMRELASVGSDSHDVDAAVAVADALAMAPRWAHVRTIIPGRDETTTVVTLGDGTRVVAAHGHEWAKGKHWQWWEGQSLGDTDQGRADILLCGHSHYLMVHQRSQRTVVQAPAMEAESTWWRRKTGQTGRPGIVTMLVSGGSPDRICVHRGQASAGE